MTIDFASVYAAAREDSRRLVHVERDPARPDRVVVRLDDPDKRNVLSAAMNVQLRDALAELTIDPSLRSIILTGTDPAFSAGGDLRLMQQGVDSLQDPESPEGSTLMWRWIRKQFGSVARLIAGSDVPVICALNGAAAGVGLAYALASDLILASERATLVPAFGRIGLVPEVGTSWLLARRLGHARAFAFYVRGEHIDAETAASWGLVTEVTGHGELLDTAHQWADRLAALPPYAPAIAKALLRQAADMSWEQALTTEEFAEPNCFTTVPFADAISTLISRDTG